MKYNLRHIEYREDREVDLRAYEEAGFRLIHPEANQLQIDIDSSYQNEQFIELWKLFITMCPEAFYEAHASKSGLPRMHITVSLPFEVETEHERIMFQALLGSDLKREMMNLNRLDNGVIKPIIFFEKETS